MSAIQSRMRRCSSKIVQGTTVPLSSRPLPLPLPLRATCPLMSRSNSDVLMEGKEDWRLNQQFCTKAGNWRWSPMSSSFFRDFTANTDSSVGSITSQASSTTTAKGSAARRACRRRDAPTTVAPTICVRLRAAELATARSLLASMTPAAIPVRSSPSTAAMLRKKRDAAACLSRRGRAQLHSCRAARALSEGSTEALSSPGPSSASDSSADPASE
mmetsp:Transcript_24153/g.53715  ORF Transcript_24153/g.53715 Transcript_24153/m.53715 type:complete len:215 (-) Transcript_24153:3404-4048(-)